MKKTLLALALIGTFCGVAQARADVTVYGSIDAGLRNQTNTDAAGDSLLSMGSNGTYRSNRLGFKGIEDLGGGLNAHFVLETGFKTATGALNNSSGILFQRAAAVGLSGSLGDINLGRQYTVAFHTIAAYDPFGFKYPGITYAISATAGTRYDNDIQYTGKFGPVTARAEYALGEVPGSTSNGATQAVGANYDSGPLRLGTAYTTSKQNVGSSAKPNYQDYKHYTLGGAYRFGAATAYLGYANEKQATATVDDTAKWTWAGLRYKLSSKVALTGAWYRVSVFQHKASKSVAAGDGRKDLYMIGATYALSKRTTLYSEIDRNSLDGGYASGGTQALNQSHQTGISFGMMHMF